MDNVSTAPSQLRAAGLPIKDSVTKKERVTIANTRCIYLIELLSYLTLTDQNPSAPSKCLHSACLHGAKWVTRSSGAVYSNQGQTTQLLLHNTTTTDFQTSDPAYLRPSQSFTPASITRGSNGRTQDITHVHERGSTAKTAVSLAQPRATHSLRNDDHPRPSAPLVRVCAPIRSSNPLLSEPQPCSRTCLLLAIRTLLSSFVAAERDCLLLLRAPSYLPQRCYRAALCVETDSALLWSQGYREERYWPLRMRR